MNHKNYIIGIDEAGRGPLAGPVSIGLVIVEKSIYSKKILRLVRDIKGKDSKKLSHEARELWFLNIKAWKQEKILDFHVALISEKIIDSRGISFAIKKGIDECLQKVGVYLTPDLCEIKLDGSLKAPIVFKNQETIIKGDEKVPIISLASIAAKVTRDRYMVKISKKYPHYALEIHKGYGTKRHRDNIARFGLSPCHRASFCRNIGKK